MSDLVVRKADVLEIYATLYDVFDDNKAIRAELDKIYEMLNGLLPVDQEIKPISYRDCANAMLMMWMDNVVTDGEYNRIMDKLNAHEIERRANETD